jgi:hypothetical protein
MKHLALPLATPARNVAPRSSLPAPVKERATDTAIAFARAAGTVVVQEEQS